MKKVVMIFIIIAVVVSGCSHSSNNVGKDGAAAIKVHLEAPEKLLQIREEGLAPFSYINAVVVGVTDGDTVKVNYKGQDYKVRLLCVDTPESVKRGVSVQQYSKEAQAFTKRLTLGQKVRLVFEKQLRDKYKRVLAHIILKDNSYFNALLVTNGFARVEIVSPNNSLSVYFYKLQALALKGRVGLWGLPKDEQPFVKSKKGTYIPRYWQDQNAS
jgi:micrococcal nuclease